MGSKKLGLLMIELALIVLPAHSCIGIITYEINRVLKITRVLYVSSCYLTSDCKISFRPFS